MNANELHDLRNEIAELIRTNRTTEQHALADQIIGLVKQRQDEFQRYSPKMVRQPSSFMRSGRWG